MNYRRNACKPLEGDRIVRGPFALVQVRVRFVFTRLANTAIRKMGTLFEEEIGSEAAKSR